MSRDHRAVAEVELDALPAARRAAAVEDGADGRAGGEQETGQEATTPHRSSFSRVRAWRVHAWRVRLRLGLLLFLAEAAQAALEVIERRGPRSAPSWWSRQSPGRRRGRRRHCRPGVRRRAARPPCRPRPAPLRARSSSGASEASSPARSSSTVEASTVPSRSKTTALWIWLEISVRSASAWAVAIGSDANTAHTPGHARSAGEVLRRRGPHLAAMIAYFALLSFVPLLFLTISAARARGAAPTSRATWSPSSSAHFPAARSSSMVTTVRVDPEPRDGPRDRRRRRAALVLALALQRPRVRLQHRLREAEPVVPAREAAGGRADALSRSSRSSSACWSGRSASTCSSATRPASPGNPLRRVQPFGRRFTSSEVFAFLISVYYLLTNVETVVSQRPTGSRDRGRRLLRDELPGVAALRPLLAQRARRFKAFGGPALLLVWLYVMANLDRVRCRGELVARRATAAG